MRMLTTVWRAALIGGSLAAMSPAHAQQDRISTDLEAQVRSYPTSSALKPVIVQFAGVDVDQLDLDGLARSLGGAMRVDSAS